jgi:hypothetical protein
MQAEENDREQIDLLVRDLMTPKRAVRSAVTQPPAVSEPPGVAPLPAVVQPPTAAQPPAPVQASAFAQLVDKPEAEPRPGSRWSNVRLLMPAERTGERSSIGAAIKTSLGPAINFAQRLPVPRFISATGQVAAARMWVALSAVFSATLIFWPYPKTYLWGMVFYILSIGIAVVSGVWGARLSWEARLGAAHTVSVGTVFWAIGLAAVNTLPVIS